MALIVGLIAAAFALGNLTGGTIMDWKTGAEVALAVSAKEKAESRNSILEAANSNCATDIEGVKKGVAVVIAQVEERERAASAAMTAAELLAARHSDRAREIKNLPPVPPEPEAQCAAIVQEQIRYVESRHE